MFEFLSQWLTQKPKKSPRSYRPQLESLEDRWCPDASHITLYALVLSGHMVQLSGTITGEHVAGFNVTFSGAASGSTTSDSSGNFSLTTSQANLGTVYASGIDGSAHATDTANATIAKTPPSLILFISYGSQRTITASGTVSDLDPVGRTVTIGGVASGSLTTNSLGQYSLTTTASALGQVTASVTDAWGQTSYATPFTLTSDVPVIENFTAIHGAGNVWTFQGRVVDESAAGLTVYFGGLGSLMGQSVTVDTDGTFTFTRTLDPMMDLGHTATAIVTDWWGLESAEAWCDVS